MSQTNEILGRESQTAKAKSTEKILGKGNEDTAADFEKVINARLTKIALKRDEDLALLTGLFDDYKLRAKTP